MFQQVASASVLLRPDGVSRPGDRVGVSLDDYLNFPFALGIELPSEATVEGESRDLGLVPEEIDLVVLVIAPRLRVVDVAFRAGLADRDEIPDRIQLTNPARPRAFRAPHGGANIQVCFCLNRWKERRSLAPWRLGTWLGREEFAVRSTLSESGFTPMKLTDLDRDRMGLPRETSRFATLEDQDPFDPDPGPNSLRLYVDEELLDRLAVAASTPAGRQLQRQLFLDAVTAIVFSTIDRVREAPELADSHIDMFEGSLTHRIVSLLGGKGLGLQDDRQVAYRSLLEEPVTFLARVEAEAGLRQEILAALEAER
jgi:hypothetical protein